MKINELLNNPVNEAQETISNKVLGLFNVFLLMHMIRTYFLFDHIDPFLNVCEFW